MIKFLITRERVNEVLTPPEYFGLLEGSMTENYHAMLRFMVDDDNKYLTNAQAVKVMRDTDMDTFWKEHLPAFARSLKEAFVSPMNAGS
jgi:hypothetical protein